MSVLREGIRGFMYCVMLFTIGVLLVGCKPGGKEKVAENKPALEGMPQQQTAKDLQSITGEGEGGPTITIGQIKENPSLLAINAVFSGKIEETIDVQGYTYMKLKDATGDMWAAVSASPGEFKEGDTVKITKASVMGDFYSKTLDRTFDFIIFGQVAGKEAGMYPSGTQVTPPSSSVKKRQQIEIGNLPKATGDNAYTIEQIFTKKDELGNKEVILRGVVVKYSSGILGKNWLHIQDGTGTLEAGNNDLTVTVTGQSKIGDTVLVQGVLHLNKEVGPGYFYDVIMEDADITVEKEG